MDKRVVVDASVWISRVMPQDVNHDASSSWTERFTLNGGILAASSFLLIEVAGAVSRLTREPKLSREAIEELTNLPTVEIVHLNPALINSAIDAATDLQLRAGDATYVALAHQLNIPLVSWDKEQLQRASTIIATYTPDHYPFEKDAEKVEEGDNGRGT